MKTICVVLLSSWAALAGPTILNHELETDGGFTLLGPAAPLRAGQAGVTSDGGITLVGAGAPLGIGQAGFSTDGGGYLTNGNLVIALDAGQGRIGIGTATPAYEIDIVKNITGAGGLSGPRVAVTNTNSAGWSSFAWVNDVGFATNNLYSSSYSFTAGVASYYYWFVSNPNLGYIWDTGNASAGYFFWLNSVEKAHLNSTGFATAGEVSVGLNFKLADYTDDSATTGSRTVSKQRGKSAFAAAATSITITNTKVTTASDVACHLSTLDATCTSVVCVEGSGSFVATVNAACTGTTKLSWHVTN